MRATDLNTADSLNFLASEIKMPGNWVLVRNDSASLLYWIPGDYINLFSIEVRGLVRAHFLKRGRSTSRKSLMAVARASEARMATATREEVKR